MMIAAYAAPRTRAAILSAEKRTDTNMQRAVLITGVPENEKENEV